MTFFEHLSELRKRIINSLIAIVIGAAIGWFAAPHFVNLIVKPMVERSEPMHISIRSWFTRIPLAILTLLITLSIYIGIVRRFPWVLYQIWQFVAPALYKHERSAITGFLFSTVFLFLSGIAFGYFISLPYVLRFLISFQGPVVAADQHRRVFRSDSSGASRAWLGVRIARPDFLSHALWYRHSAISDQRISVTPLLVIAVLAAILTPTPDALTMLRFHGSC